MPAEKFYYTGQVEGDGRGPDLVVSWGSSWREYMDGRYTPALLINGDVVGTADDMSGIDRLITTLKRARRAVRATGSLTDPA